MSPQIEAKNLSELQSRLWNIADTLRGKMNAMSFVTIALVSSFTNIFPRSLSLMPTKS